MQEDCHKYTNYIQRTQGPIVNASFVSMMGGILYMRGGQCVALGLYMARGLISCGTLISKALQKLSVQVPACQMEVDGTNIVKEQENKGRRR